MVNKLNKIFSAIFLAILIFSSISCKKNNEEIHVNVKEGFIVKNGIISFESKDLMLKTIYNIANLTEKDRAKWEIEHGFISQRRIIQNIIKDEVLQDSLDMKKYAGISVDKINKSDNHSLSYKNALSKGIIKLINEGTSEEYWDYNIYDHRYIDYINEDGLFAIGDTLYQVTNNSLKGMKTNNYSNAHLLIEASKPDEKNNIFFIFKLSSLKASSPGPIGTDWGYSSTRKNRLNLTINLSIYNILYGGNNNCSFNLINDVYVQCQYRNWLGNWKYDDAETDLTITGSWTISCFYYPQYYSGSFSSFYLYANDYKSSHSPDSGNTSPYQSIFQINPNSQNINVPWYIADQTTYQPVWESYHFTASRNGGCCGINVSLNK